MNGRALAEQVQVVLVRYLDQNHLAPLPSDRAAGLAARLVDSVLACGLPSSLPLGPDGPPPEIPASAVDTLAAAVLAGHERTVELSQPVRQMLKACLQPEFRQCRRSYRAVGNDGVCRRQHLVRARERVSGTHCVDCPYWTVLGAAEHERFLSSQWLGDRAEFAANRAVFLPEDFRALRVAVCRAPSPQA